MIVPIVPIVPPHPEPTFTVLLGALLLGLAATPGHAQTARGGNAGAQLQLQLQELASENASLQADNDKLKKELQGLDRERDALRGAREVAERRIAASAVSVTRGVAENSAAEAQIAAIRTQTEVAVARFRETLQTIRRSEGETGAAKQQLAARERELSTCIDRDLALYGLDEEILRQFDGESPWKRIARAEPFTGLARVRHENVVDDFRFRADGLRWKPP